jgi:hypothetical protein
VAHCAVILKAETRTWQDASGKFKIEAELLEVNEDSVRLRKADGKEISVPIARLSKNDQDFVQASQKSTTSSDPLDAIVRIMVPILGSDGNQQETQAVGVAIMGENNHPPTVITSRLSLKGGMESNQIDGGLAKAEIFNLRTPQRLATASRLGFPGPLQPDVVAGMHELLIVLPVAEGTQLATLKLAEKDPVVGDIVRLPILPSPQQNSRTPPKIEWTNWTVYRIDASRMYVEPQDRQFPSTGAVPILNSANEVVGLYTSKVILGDDKRARGDGPPVSLIRAALKKAEASAPAVAAQSNEVVEAGRSQTKLPPIPNGPIDKSAAWRTSYEAFMQSVKTQKNDKGEWTIDWGDASDFGVWYERCRVMNPEMLKAMQNPEQRNKIFASLQPLKKERDRAAERLTGVVWTAVAKQISASEGASCRFELPEFPEPLRFTFWVEKGDSANWRNVKKGDKVRFACRFTSNGLAEEPGVEVRMTFQEVVKQ